MSTLRIIGRKGNRKKLKHLSRQLVQDDRWYWPDGAEIDSRHELISLMLPSAVKVFYSDMEAELKQMCGERYSRAGTAYRWGESPGSIVLGKQKVAIKKPRIRDAETNQEIAIPSYERFQDPSLFNEGVFVEGLKKVSQRDYKRGLPEIAASFGISKSAISRRWTKATAKKVGELLNRDLRPMDILAVFIDGKRFRKYGVIVALGVSSNGKKIILGIYQASTEDHKNCLELLGQLERRGLPCEGLVFIVDGGSGLNKALEIKYAVDKPEIRKAVRLRCHYHKWENIRAAIDEKDIREAQSLFWGMRSARTYSEARAFSDQLETTLKLSNLSALHSYQEAKDELLTLHQLNLGSELRTFFSTTNPIESLNSMTEEDLRRVKRWQNSEHFQRWLSTSCLHNEKRMYRIRGHRGLPLMREAVKILCHLEKTMDSEVAFVS
jgi:putative transposase